MNDAKHNRGDCDSSAKPSAGLTLAQGLLLAAAIGAFAIYIALVPGGWNPPETAPVVDRMPPIATSPLDVDP